jgi:hypothetical protein
VDKVILRNPFGTLRLNDSVYAMPAVTAAAGIAVCRHVKQADVCAMARCSRWV